MKRIIGLVIVCVMLFAGCSAAVTVDEAQLKERTQQVAQQLLDGDFAGVEAQLAPMTKAQLSAQQLEEAWNETVGALGDYEGLGEYTSVFEQNTATGLQIYNFEQSDVRLSVTFDGNGKISGLWLKYTPKTVEPQETGTYAETPVQVGEFALDGMLTIPKGVERPPVVVLIQGSGATNMDEQISGNKPFADIAHGLAERGMASLRYNKRTYQAAEQMKEITIEAEILDDAKAAVALLRERGEFGKIVVAGHSLGAMMSPEIARANELDGLISMAGTPRHLSDIIVAQNQVVLDASGQTEAQTEATMKLVNQQAEQAKAASKENGENVILGMTEGYWTSLNRYNNAQVAQELAIPMLFLQGGKDLVVQPTNLAAWRETLGDKAQYRLFDNLNHVFFVTQQAVLPEDYSQPQQVDDAVIAAMAEFVHGM